MDNLCNISSQGIHFVYLNNLLWERCLWQLGITLSETMMQLRTESRQIVETGVPFTVPLLKYLRGEGSSEQNCTLLGGSLPPR